TGRDRHQHGSAKSQLAEETAGPLRAIASEPAEQLLCSVPEHRAAHDHAEQQQSIGHGSPFQVASRGVNDSCGVNYSRVADPETAATGRAAAFGAEIGRAHGLNSSHVAI